MTFSDLSEEFIIQQLKESHDPPSDEGYPSEFLSDAPRPAAVLVPLLRAKTSPDRSPEWHILLTRRSEALAEHRGQVAFPGGRSDLKDKSPESTALREAEEEIGIKPTDVRILGKLNNIWTITNYSVTPVVGVIPWPYLIQLAKYEVSRAFIVPLAWLSDPSHHEVRQRTIPPPYSLQLHTDSFPVIYFQPYDQEILWGVSAEIVISLLRTLSI
jgi:8-oxo-dGTP pyrophosphatase MutT (NUDIX family)